MLKGIIPAKKGEIFRYENKWLGERRMPVERFKSKTQSVTNEMVWRHSRERF